MAEFKNSQLLTEDVIPVRQVAKYCPNRPSLATAYRWVNKGVTRSDGVKIRLECIKIGTHLMTSKQAEGVTRSDGVKIRLECIKIGTHLMTSKQAVTRFIVASQTECVDD